MEDSRIRRLAQTIIQFATQTKVGDRILLEQHGGQDFSLLKALIQEAYAVGAKPYYSITQRDLEAELIRGADLPHMREFTQYEIERMKAMDVYVDIRVDENLFAWNGLPSEGLDAYYRGYWGPLHMDLRTQSTRWTVLYYPTQATAQLAGMNLSDFEDFFFDSTLVTYEKMGRAMQPLVELMHKTDQVKIIAPGTDLQFSIKNIGIMAMHGNRNLPDGEIYTAPIRESVNGTIRYNIDSRYQDFVFKDVSFVFKNGKIVEASANDNKRLNRILDTDEGARYIGEFAIGVNPMITKGITNIIYDEKMSGSFHLTPGNCYNNAENGNKSSIHWDLIQSQRPEHGGGQIFFDGKCIRDNGVFIPESLQGLNPENLLENNLSR
ncbi:MAG: aminopeptidase [Anaerolineaceae bacterium]|nr:aminopeptidase [Anaerolineaceae bacterium]